MFDVGRALAFAWAIYVAWRARSWLGLFAAALAAYVFGLEVASGITIRSEGTFDPIVALLPALIGPTAMPRGQLPSLPLAFSVVHYPIVVDAIVVAALLASTRLLARRIDDLPQFSDATRALARVVLALSLLAVLAGLAAGTRALPELLDWGSGDRVLPPPPWR